jgi:hypothetical protein
LLGELRELGKACKDMKSVSPYQEIVDGSVLADVANGLAIVEKSNLGHPVVGWVEPLVPPVLVGEETKVLVRPGQFQAARRLASDLATILERA